MKKINVILDEAVDFVIKGGVDSGVVVEKGVYQAKIGRVNDDGETYTVFVPYKNIIECTEK